MATDLELAYADDSVYSDIVGNELYFAEVVAGGELDFTNKYLRGMRGLSSDARAKHMWHRLVTNWGRSHPLVSAKIFLDAVETVSPPTERDIQRAWKWDSASSERALRQMYGTDMGPVNLNRED